MSLDKAIEHGKEKRKQYRGCKAVDRTCRNHGSCKWCEFGRLHKFKKDMPVEESEHNEWKGKTKFEKIDSIET